MFSEWFFDVREYFPPPDVCCVRKNGECETSHRSGGGGVEPSSVIANDHFRFKTLQFLIMCLGHWTLSFP